MSNDPVQKMIPKWKAQEINDAMIRAGGLENAMGIGPDGQIVYSGNVTKYIRH